jgi:hypothetical protein
MIRLFRRGSGISCRHCGEPAPSECVIHICKCGKSGQCNGDPKVRRAFDRLMSANRRPSLLGR